MSTEILCVKLGFTTTYVLRGSGCVVVDCGCPGKGDLLAGVLAANGISPDEVELIVLTHAHSDHIGSASEIKALTGAALAVHHSEIRWLEDLVTEKAMGALKGIDSGT